MSEALMNQLLNNFRGRMRDTRMDNDETQAELAEAIDTSQTMIARYERGASTPSVMTLMKICAHYRVSADYLLGIPESYDHPR